MPAKRLKYLYFHLLPPKSLTLETLTLETLTLETLTSEIMDADRWIIWIQGHAFNAGVLSC